MATPLGEQPIAILSDTTHRIAGKDAQRTNIHVACAVSDSLKTTLGPKGMDKIMVNYYGWDSGEFRFDITNDGLIILDGWDTRFTHPIVKMIVSIAKTQEREVGDGTTTAVVLAGELLKSAEKLLDKNVHQTIITGGYKLAAEKAKETLKSIGIDISADDESSLRKIAMTALSGKAAEDFKEYLAGLAVRAVKVVAEIKDGKLWVDKDFIKIEKKPGGGIEDTELIHGLIVTGGRANPSMPKRIEKAKIAIITSSHIKVKDTKSRCRETPIDLEYKIRDRKQIKLLYETEEKLLKEMVEKIKNTGANVLITEKGVDDVANDYLTRLGIFALPGVGSYDLEKLARATGAKMVPDVKRLTKDDLGYAGIVEEQKIGEDRKTFVRDCKEPKSVTILIRGSTEHLVNEIESSLRDCTGVVSTAITGKTVVAGGGAAEMEVAKKLRKYARTVSGKEQLAIEAFADAMEEIPRALAQNAGLDSINTILALRASHQKRRWWWPWNNATRMGIDVYDGRIKDMFKEGIIEPLGVKTQAINSASEVAAMILRIDDLIFEEFKAPTGEVCEERHPPKEEETVDRR